MSLLLANGEPRRPVGPLQGTACNPADFVFKDGVFYATFEGHIHPRKNAEELYEHLNYEPPFPIITDSGRTWLPPPDSHTTYKPDFYSAQLLHYGLKPLKTKGPAKKRLLAAFGGPDGTTLEIPKSILELEESMRDWWHKSNPAMMVELKAESEIPLQNRDVEMKFDAPESTQIDALSSSSKALQANPAPKTKRTAVKRTAPAGATIPNPAPKRQHMTKQTARRGGVPPSFGREHSRGEQAGPSRKTSPPRYLTKQTARRGGRLAGVEARASVKKFEKPIDTPKRTGAEMRVAIRSLKAEQSRHILAVLLDRLPGVGRIIDMELSAIENHTDSSKAKEKVVNPSEWTGLYDIEAPSLEADEYGDENHTLEIYPSSTSSHLWASFEFGVVSGVMRSIHPVPNFLNTEIYFEWRGRESGESPMTFGGDNRAIITFLPGGLLEGKMCGGRFKTFKVYGSIQVRTPYGITVEHKSDSQQRKEVRSWKNEWRGLNDHNYNVERIARWGKWGGNTKDEQAFESDTTAGKGKRSWKIDLQNFMKDPDTDSEKWHDKLDEVDSGDDDEYEWRG